MLNNYQINLNSLSSGSTNYEITVPITMDFQAIGQAEVIDQEFVAVETESAINSIADYDKVRFLPTTTSANLLNDVIYMLNISGSTNYGGIGFTNDEIKYEKNNFTHSFLNLSFYDTNNPLTQRLITFVTLFCKIGPNDLLPSTSIQQAIYGDIIGYPGQPKPASQIPLMFTLSSPIFNPLGFSEGYHLYDYKNELNIGESKYLYMKASFKNAKSGKSINLMVKNATLPINELVNELYTRYRLYRTTTGYYYEIDDQYDGVTTTTSLNNVVYTNNNVLVNLYQISAT